MSRIDAPQLNESRIGFFEDKGPFEKVDLDTPQFARFISCASTSKARDEAHIHLDDFDTTIRIPLLSPEPSSPSRELTVDINDGEAYWPNTPGCFRPWGQFAPHFHPSFPR